MPRVLTMHEHRVTAAERAGYINALRARRDHAKAVHVNFWVFEDGAEHGRFVEFIEAENEQALAAAHTPRAPGALWHEVEAT